MIRVFIVDDHKVLRSGLQLMLAREADVEVVGEASEGTGLLEQLATTPVDVVLLDLHMPGMPGLEVVRLLQARHPEVQVLVLSMASETKQIVELFEAGVRGFMLKTASLAEVLHGLRTVAAGLPFLCSGLGLAALRQVYDATAASEPLPRQPSAAEPETGVLRPLTSREMEVLRLVAEGLTNQEIADRLYTSKRTIETHRQNLLAKTKAKNTAALIRLAVSEGLLAKSDIGNTAV